MFKKLFTAAAVIFSMVSVAHAEVAYSMPSLEVGFKLNTIDGKGATSNKQVQGFQAGGSIVFDFAENFGLKTGLMYSERPFKYETGVVTTEGQITYFDIPVHVMFKFEDYAGIFFGPSFSTKMGDECKVSGGGSCGSLSAKSTIMPLTFGAQFKFMPNLGLSLFFETISGEVATGLESSRGLGANLLFTFN
jgi:hypothetical protein